MTIKPCWYCGGTGKTGDKPIGRPPRLDDAEVRRLRKSGLPVKEIAEKYGVGIKAVYASLYRSGK